MSFGIKIKTFFYLSVLIILLSCSKAHNNDCPDVYFDLTFINQTSDNLIISYDVIGDICLLDKQLDSSYDRFTIQSGETINNYAGDNNAKSIRCSILDKNNMEIFTYLKDHGNSIKVIITSVGASYSYHLEFI